MGRAPLIAAGGALVLDHLVASDWIAALGQEARAARARAVPQHRATPRPGGWRAAMPAQKLCSAPGGPVLDAVYADRGLAHRIGGLVGTGASPTGSRGSYSFYDRPGDFLGLHRDILTCDVTLIVCLERSGGAAPEVGALRLYPAAARHALEEITATSPARDIQMRPGQAVVLLGGVIPHRVLPADATFRRSIAVLCFRAGGGRLTQAARQAPRTGFDLTL
jgi:hypothetical protein